MRYLTILLLLLSSCSITSTAPFVYEEGPTREGVRLRMLETCQPRFYHIGRDAQGRVHWIEFHPMMMEGEDVVVFDWRLPPGLYEIRCDDFRRQFFID